MNRLILLSLLYWIGLMGLASADRFAPPVLEVDLVVLRVALGFDDALLDPANLAASALAIPGTEVVTNYRLFLPEAQSGRLTVGSPGVLPFEQTQHANEFGRVGSTIVEAPCELVAHYSVLLMDDGTPLLELDATWQPFTADAVPDPNFQAVTWHSLSPVAMDTMKILGGPADGPAGNTELRIVIVPHPIPADYIEPQA
ncbi:MAG: hypothetical protein ABI743_02555 [bacterium]